jgi:hypothetical protein
MKNPFAHFCAALLLTASFPALASDIPRPEKKPDSFKVAMADAQTEAPRTQTKSVKMDTITLTKKNDLKMSCGELSQEAQKMRDFIYLMEEKKTNSKIKSHGVTAAGAVGSLLIGTATGGVGLALGGFLLDQNFKDKTEVADEAQDIAEQRRTLMMGIFRAKDCQGPIEHAMQNPEKFNAVDMIAAIEPAAGESKYQPDLRKRYNE